MEDLKNRIVYDGVCLGTDIVKVDSFLNHKLDVAFIEKMGAEIGRIFEGVKIDKILTIESSGIAVACAASRYLGNVPVVFAKKTVPNTLGDEFYGSEVRSFTKGTVSTAVVSKKYLMHGEDVLIVDDFLAHGEAAMGLADLIEQAGGKVVGIAAAIEKQFQGGAARLREKGYRVESLAVIKSIKDGVIEFE